MSSYRKLRYQSIIGSADLAVATICNGLCAHQKMQKVFAAKTYYKAEVEARR